MVTVLNMKTRIFPNLIQISSISFYGRSPQMNINGQCYPYVEIIDVKKDSILYSTKQMSKKYVGQSHHIILPNQTPLVADILINVKNHGTLSDSKMFRFSFNTAFIEKHVTYQLNELDPTQLQDDQRFDKQFRVERSKNVKIAPNQIPLKINAKYVNHTQLNIKRHGAEQMKLLADTLNLLKVKQQNYYSELNKMMMQNPYSKKKSQNQLTHFILKCSQKTNKYNYDVDEQIYILFNRNNFVQILLFFQRYYQQILFQQQFSVSMQTYAKFLLSVTLPNKKFQSWIYSLSQKDKIQKTRELKPQSKTWWMNQRKIKKNNDAVIVSFFTKLAQVNSFNFGQHSL